MLMIELFILCNYLTLNHHFFSLKQKNKNQKHLLHHLLSETQLFVDKLFEAINNKSYLPQPEQPSASVKVEKDEPKKEEVMLSP